MDVLKRIASVAHDNCKKDMVEWVDWNWSILLDHQLICTGTTGRLVEEALARQVDSMSTRCATSRQAEVGAVRR